MLEHTRSEANALDEPAFSKTALARKDDVLLAADEVPLSQRFDLESGNRRVEVPVEGAQGQRLAEVGVLDEAFGAALSAQAGLSGEQAVQELQVRSAILFGVGQGGVELVGRHRHAQSREVGEDLITQAWAGRGRIRRRIFLLGTGFHGKVPRVRVIVDSRWPDADQSDLRATRGAACRAGWSVRRAIVLAWPWRPGCAGWPPVRRRRSGPRVRRRRTHRPVGSGRSRPGVAGLGACPGLAWRAGHRGTARRPGQVRRSVRAGAVYGRRDHPPDDEL